MEFEQKPTEQTERNFCQNANLPGGAGAAAPPKILCVSQQCAMIGQAGLGQAVKQKRTMLWTDPFDNWRMKIPLSVASVSCRISFRAK